MLVWPPASSNGERGLVLHAVTAAKLRAVTLSGLLITSVLAVTVFLVGMSASAIAMEEVGARVQASFLASDRTYGARRVWRDVLGEGIACGLHKIGRLMRA